jgi:uncharacterized membrane protein
MEPRSSMHRAMAQYPPSGRMPFDDMHVRMYEMIQPTMIGQGAGPTGMGFAGLFGLLVMTAITPNSTPPGQASDVSAGLSGRWESMKADDLSLVALPLAIGAIGFGLLGFIHAEFWLQWQLVYEALPMRGSLAFIGNALLILAGVMLGWRRTAMPGAALLAGFYGLWAVAVHAQRLAGHPLNAGVWLAFTEVLAFAIGGALLSLLLADRLRLAAIRCARIAFGGCAVLFGICHFVYLDITAGMVPAWLPARHLFAGLTGVAHIAAGISLLSGVRARLAATLFTVMIIAFAVLVHIPRVAGNPTSHMEWAMLFIAVSLAGAAWILRAAVVAEETRDAGSVQNPTNIGGMSPVL